MKKVNLYYGTEENAYEPELIGEFDTEEQAKQEAERRLKEVDGVQEDEIAEMEMDNGYDGFDCQEYHIVYLIGEKRECKSQLKELREEFISML